MSSVRFYFDCISPYVWLAFTQLEAWEKKNGVSVEIVPTLFGVLLDANGNVGPAEIPAKRAYTFFDAARLAAHHDLAMVGPPAHPFIPLKALRLVCAVDTQREKHRLGLALCHAAWRDGHDITDDEVLRRVLTAEGFSADKLLAAMQTPEVKQRLMDSTRSAVENGVFGVPTFQWNGDLFWGCDRMELLGRFVRKELQIDRRPVEIALARPRAVDRKQAPKQ